MSIVLVGSTSGSITLQEPAVSGSTVLSLPAVSGTVLTTTSPKAGNVIQVVNSTTNNSQTSTTSTSFVTTGFSLAITPTSSTSKILVLVSLAGTNTSTGSSVVLTLYRGATQLNSNGLGLYENSSSSGYQQVQLSFNYLDSPATTSSTTYTIYFKKTGSGTAFCGNSDGGQMITLMEIAA